MKINLYFHSYTATTNEKFVGSSGTWTRTFGFLDRRSTHWAIKWFIMWGLRRLRHYFKAKTHDSKYFFQKNPKTTEYFSDQISNWNKIQNKMVSSEILYFCTTKGNLFCIKTYPSHMFGFYTRKTFNMNIKGFLSYTQLSSQWTEDWRASFFGDIRVQSSAEVGTHNTAVHTCCTYYILTDYGKIILKDSHALLYNYVKLVLLDFKKNQWKYLTNFLYKA